MTSVQELNSIQKEKQRMIEEVERMRKDSTGIGAIPETSDYANGWNDCRKTAKKMRDKTLEQFIAIIKGK